jgi:hypothetical protein
MKVTNVEEKALARLKASKLGATDEMYRDGELAGATYVLREAEFREMERLERWHDRLGTNADAVMSQLSFLAVAGVMTGEDGAERDIEDQMRKNHGDEIDEELWLGGFIDGALKKYAELSSKLD